jgi:hypothetical protein
LDEERQGRVFKTNKIDLPSKAFHNDAVNHERECGRLLLTNIIINMDNEKIRINAKVYPSPEPYFRKSANEIDEQKLRYSKSFNATYRFIVSILIWELIFYIIKINQKDFNSELFIDPMIFLFKPISVSLLY